MKDGIADAAFELPAAGKEAGTGRGRLDEKPAGGTACLFLATFAQEEERLARRLGFQAEAAAFRQAEMSRIAPDFEDDGAEGAAFQRSLGKPERIVEPARCGVEKATPSKAEMNEADGMGQTRLHRCDGVADP